MKRANSLLNGLWGFCMTRFYKGSGRVREGGIQPMDKIDRLFWANKDRYKQDRLDRIAARKERDNVGK